MNGKRIDDLRAALLTAHKALIEDAKRAYIEAGNRQPTPVEFWHLLINDPAFQWLRRISETIVAIDEALDKGTMDEAKSFALAKEELIDEAGPEFSDKLNQAVTRDPRVRAAWESVVACLDNGEAKS